MKICYLTTLAPYGKGETFVLREIDAVQALGHEVVVVPLRPEKDCLDDRYTVFRLGAHSGRCYRMAARLFCRHPLACLKPCLRMLSRAGGFRKAVKNLFFLPKALAVAQYLRACGDFDFIHAHWLATVSTAGYIASAITGIPWGMTGHRWDLYENNGIREKARTAQFVRTISQKGFDYVQTLVCEGDRGKVVKIYLGIDLPNELPAAPARREGGCFALCMPANFVEIKGHRYVVEAFRLLAARGVRDVHCTFYGEGETREEMLEMIERYGLGKLLSAPGYLPNSELLALYRQRKIDAVLLPSVSLSDSEHEGIPVGLMEAMSYGVPVVSTDTGGIAELIGDGCGCVVEQKNPQAIADAICRLKDDDAFYQSVAENGREKVSASFDNLRNTKALLTLFGEKRRPSGIQEEKP